MRQRGKKHPQKSKSKKTRKGSFLLRLEKWREILSVLVDILGLFSKLGFHVVLLLVFWKACDLIFAIKTPDDMISIIVKVVPALTRFLPFLGS